MGQTLTHGVYLPDEGERNCYSGLAANWQLLDGAVGTIAEHTSALSGKAPLVHTHTKSDITDFPAYGNTAGTICEGNDSRLSDARTPVAHTHTKSDVTDLFNSANTWSGDNTYSKTVAIERSTDTGNFLALKNSVAELGSTPASATPVTIAYRDKNDENLGYMGVYYDTDGSNLFRLYVRNKFTSGAPSTSGTVDYAYFGLRLNADKSKEGIIKASFRPYDNNAYDLGSSSYQWNNLYAKNYYYNGTQWGLDQNNTWTGANIFYKSIQIYGSRNAYIMPEFGASYSGLAFGTVEFKQSFKFGDWVDNNSTIGLNTSNAYVEIYAGLDSSDGVNKARLNPINTTVAELGTSTNKWKTLNGINPGALSLPKIVAKATANIASAIVGTDGETQYLDSTDNYYTAALDGWISMCIGGFTQSNELWITVYDMNKETWGTSAESSTSARNTLFIIFPIRANQKMRIRMKCTSVTYARFYPCEGNV